MKQKLLSLLLICLLAFGVVPQTAGAEAADITYLENELKEVRCQLNAYELDRLNMELFTGEWSSNREELSQTYSELQQFYNKGKLINRTNLVKKTISLGLETYETGTDTLSVGTGAALKRSIIALSKWGGQKALGEIRKEIAEAGGANHFSKTMTPFTTEVGKSLPELEELTDFLAMDIKQSQAWLKENENIALTEEKSFWLSEKNEEITREDATILARWRVLLEKTEKGQQRLAEMIRQGDRTEEQFRPILKDWPPAAVHSLQYKEKELVQRLEAAKRQQSLDAAKQEIEMLRADTQPALALPPLVSEQTDRDLFNQKKDEAYQLLSSEYPPLSAILHTAAGQHADAVSEATGLRDQVLKSLEPILYWRQSEHLLRPQQIISAQMAQKTITELEPALFGANWFKDLIHTATPDLKQASEVFGQAAAIVKTNAGSLIALERLSALDSHYQLNYFFSQTLPHLSLKSAEMPLYEKDKIEQLLQWLSEVDKTQDIILAEAGSALKEAKQREALAAQRQKELDEQASPAYRFRLLQERIARESSGWFSLEPKDFFLQTSGAKDEARRFSGNDNDLDTAISGLIKTLSEMEERYRLQQSHGQTAEPPQAATPAPPPANGASTTGATTPDTGTSSLALPVQNTPVQPKPVPETKLPDLPPADYQQQVRQTLAALAAAYQQENLRDFMQIVSPYFLGDDFLLDRALRKDFRNFDNISLRLNVNSINIDARGRAQVYVHYNRSVNAQKNGGVHHDDGLTQFTFHLHDGKIKLYDMKYPVIFGVSEASLLATGEVRSAENDKILSVNRRGEVNVLPYNEAKLTSEQNGVKRGTGIRLQFSYTPEIVQGWSFADNRRTHPNSYHTVEGDFTFTTQWLNLAPGTSVRLLSATDVSDVIEAPDPSIYPYTAMTELPGFPDVLPDGLGNVYALKLSSGKYAVIKLVSYIHLNEFVFDYKYQPSGSRSF